MSTSLATPSNRVFASMTGVIPALIVIPILMSSWAPVWATASWWTAYAFLSILAWTLVLKESETVEHWWSAMTGLLFGLLPLSAQIFDPGTESLWIATCVALIAIASEVSALPHLPIYEWRLGPVFNGSLIFVAVLMDRGLLIAFAVIPVLFGILRNGDAVRGAAIRLEESVGAAEKASAHAVKLALNDELTGLPNRRHLVMELEKLQARGEYTLVMFDADRFKAINDTYGHGAGDQVLTQMAAALERRFESPWLVGRLGGDEFLAMHPGYDCAVDDSLCAPVSCTIAMYGNETTVELALSAGAVRAYQHVEIDRVLSKAGYAMRSAKHGADRLVWFTGELATSFDQMLELEGEGREALDQQAFGADYQIVVGAEGRIVGCEALSRWRRPDGTTIYPDQFLPILAESGRMAMLNELMLAKGVAFAARFNDLDNAPFVAINIGSSHLGSGRLVPFLASLLDEHDVPADRIMIEITEKEILSHEALWRGDVIELRRLGVLLAIDDFGSGYSNIDRLNALPVTHIKFDRSLAAAVDGPLREVLAGVVRFAEQSDIGIIAEGIETTAEHRAMADIGIDLFQGFSFALPESGDVVARQIRDAAAFAISKAA